MVDTKNGKCVIWLNGKNVRIWNERTVTNKVKYHIIITEGREVIPFFVKKQLFILMQKYHLLFQRKKKSRS